MEKNLLLEEISRINYISKYNLNETSVENSKVILEYFREGLSAFRDLAATREGASILRGEIEAVLKSGKEIKAVSEFGRELKTLTKASDVLKAIKENRITTESLLSLKGSIFKNTKDVRVIDAIAEDLVNSKEFVEEYAHLSNKEILDKLSRSGLKLPKNSEQSRAILNAHELKIAEDSRRFRESEQFREGEYYRSEKEWKPYESYKSDTERTYEFRRRHGERIKETIQREPKSFFKRLKDAGAFVWKGGKWVIKNIWSIFLLGLLGWGVYSWFTRDQNIGDDCDAGFVMDPTTGKCVKSGSSGEEEKITDDEGNVYQPCSGIYKINCVTKEGDGGIDYISQAQDCLGISPTGMFNKELEDRLVKKIHKRTFTKEDIKLICMAGGTLARL